MKKIIILAILCTISLGLFAQEKNPISWTFSSEKINNTEYNLVFIANISSGSALYSQHIGEGGPIPTKFIFEDSKEYKRIGRVLESDKNKEIVIDPMFEMELAKFHNEAIFTQKIKKTGNKESIKGQITFMSCSGDKCIPPTTIDFYIKL